MQIWQASGLHGGLEFAGRQVDPAVSIGGGARFLEGNHLTGCVCPV